MGLITQTAKVCSCCGIEKSAEEFYVRSDRPGKRESRCGSCKQKAANKPKLVVRRRLRQKEYRDTHKVQERARIIRWSKQNWSRVLERNRNSQRRMRQQNPGYRVRLNLSSRLSHILAGRTKSAPTMRLVGCSLGFLKVWIALHFQPGMSWGNYGEWHVDHIRPCSWFDLEDPSQQRSCFHWLNLQPLWKIDNLRKGDRLSI